MIRDGLVDRIGDLGGRNRPLLPRPQERDDIAAVEIVTGSEAARRARNQHFQLTVLQQRRQIILQPAHIGLHPVETRSFGSGDLAVRDACVFGWRQFVGQCHEHCARSAQKHSESDQRDKRPPKRFVEQSGISPFERLKTIVHPFGQPPALTVPQQL